MGKQIEYDYNGLNLDYRYNKAFFIVNKDGLILHNDSDRFYKEAQYGFGVYPLVYKVEHYAYKKAKQVNGIVVHIERGESFNMALKRNAIAKTIDDAKNGRIKIPATPCFYFGVEEDYYTKLFQ